METYSIAGINNLSDQEQREIFIPLIPSILFERFSLPTDLIDSEGNDLFTIHGDPGEQGLELKIFHKYGFQDPVLYSHMTDTLTCQIHVLLYIMNDPESPRFNTDVMPDGTPTEFGTKVRNLDAEAEAMQAGLLPGQIRSGLSLLSEAVDSFEDFIGRLKHTMYFNDPLYYHNAIIFERYGFRYQKGRRKLEEIHHRFTDDPELVAKLDGSTFRKPEAKQSIFYRSWAIHDGILGEPFTDVTMYKTLGQRAEIDTAPGIRW
jgi:hypothetical protein